MNTEFYVYQIIILITAALLIVRSGFNGFRGKKNIREFIVSVFIWGSFAALALFPNLSISLAHLLGFEVGINFILTITTILLFAAIIMLIVKTDKNNNSLTQIVRQLALKDLRTYRKKS